MQRGNGVRAVQPLAPDSGFHQSAHSWVFSAHDAKQCGPDGWIRKVHLVTGGALQTARIVTQAVNALNEIRRLRYSKYSSIRALLSPVSLDKLAGATSIPVW